MFVAGSLSSLVPEDHILKQVDKVLDLSWPRKDVADLYCSNNGRPSIDPESALRLMLAGFFEGIVFDRNLMRQAQVEGMHGEVQTQHGLRRAVRRGLTNYQVVFWVIWLIYLPY
ncbi:MAG: hypothetical protein J7M40_01895 [Planctomycetes bacterium]|nr:hypothetical protein [Planctomycetota bacterium]